MDRSVPIANISCASAMVQSTMASSQTMDLRRLDLAAHRRIRRAVAVAVRDFYGDCTQAHLDANRSWLQPRFQDPASGLLTITIQSFLVRQNGLTILVDCCAATTRRRGAAAISSPQVAMARHGLREAGVKPEDIDIVLCTHLHVDHVGWNTRLENGRWVPTFPNARYLISRREWDHWQAAGAAALVAHRRLHHRQRAADVRPRAGRSDRRRARDRERIFRSSPRPATRPARRWCGFGAGPRAGDADRRPDASSAAGALSGVEHAVLHRSGTGARRPASAFLNEHADTGRLIFPAHFPSPTGGIIERDGKDFRFIFDGESRAC